MQEDCFKSMSMINIAYSLLPQVEKLICTDSCDEARIQAITFARNYAKRNKTILLSDPNNFEYLIPSDNHLEVLPADNTDTLCKTIAISEERIAAIIINFHKTSHHYYKKLREIASAENAILIWDVLKYSIANIHIPTHSAPDILCFQLPNFSYWLALTRKL